MMLILLALLPFSATSWMTYCDGPLHRGTRHLQAYSSLNAEEWFQLGKSLYLSRKESLDIREKCSNAFQQSQILQPEWTITDGKLVTSSEINNLFLEFEHESTKHIDRKLTDDVHALRNALFEANFTAFGVQNYLNIRPNSITAGPYYIKRNIDHHSLSSPLTPNTPLALLIHLFLFGFSAIPELIIRLLGADIYSVLVSLRLISRSICETEYMVPNVQLFPLDINAGLMKRKEANNIILAVDFPPPHSANLVEEPVMYVSSCSIALVQSWKSVQQLIGSKLTDHQYLLDMCCGSGIQGIAAMKSCPLIHVDAVDINPRALRFSNFNALLNLVSDRVRVVHGNVYTSLDSRKQIGSKKYSVILANPPFVPVPPDLNAKCNRYNIFSVGIGDQGEHILKEIFEKSYLHLKPGGVIGVVSEVVNIETFNGRLLTWLTKHDLISGISGCLNFRGTVLASLSPLSALEYCKRRAGDLSEMNHWIKHFENESIQDVSQCLVWLISDTDSFDSHIDLVPVCRVWAPENIEISHILREKLCNSKHDVIINDA